MEVDVKKLARTVTRWVGSLQSIVVHTVLFVGSFAGVYFGLLEVDRMLLVMTTIVSLEAIYLAIFIQMTINEQAEDIDEIQEDIDEIQEDVEEMQEDVEEMQEDVQEMTEEDKEDAAREAAEGRTLEQIHAGLQKLMNDIERLQNRP
jgi:low affinity Fe/Cu permease